MWARAFAVVVGDPAAAVRRALIESGLALTEQTEHTSSSWHASAPELRQRGLEAAKDLGGALPHHRTLVWRAVDPGWDECRIVLLDFDFEGGYPTGGPWELPVVRRLSLLSGGFAAAVQEDRSTSERGVAVFFAGRTVEARVTAPQGLTMPSLGEVSVDGGEDSRPLDPYWEVSPIIEQLYGNVTGRDPTVDWSWDEETRAHHWAYEGGPPPALLDLAGEPPLARVFALNVEEGAVVGAIPRLRPSDRDRGPWAWRHVPAGEGSALSYLMLQRQGPGDAGLVEQVAWLLNPVSIAGVELPGGGSAVMVTLSGFPEAPLVRRTGGGVRAIIGALKAIALGTEVAPLVWPVDDPGRPL